MERNRAVYYHVRHNPEYYSPDLDNSRPKKKPLIAALASIRSNAANGHLRDAICFIAPWLLTFAVFWLYPLIFSFILGFCDYDVFGGGMLKWVGLQNYVRLFHDPRFIKAFFNTLYFTAGTTPIISVLALILAMMIESTGKAENILRSAFFLPSIISVVVISTIFKSLYSPAGMINEILMSLGFQGKAWLVEAEYAMPAIMLMSIWASVGYYVVLFLVALKSVPRQLYDAARVDGADAWQQFRYVTLPGIRYMIVFVLVINSIRSWQVFPEIFTLTRGGPLGSTDTMVHRLYETAFRYQEMGYASAMAYLLFVIILLLSLLQIRILEGRKE